MHYTFPEITEIDPLLPLVDAQPAMVVLQRGDYCVVNYNYMSKEVFGSHDTAEGRLYREMRGLVFDSRSGKLIGRPFHKFFNLNEYEEFHPDLIDLSQPHFVLEKLDGSMVHPVLLRDDLVWMTRKGHTKHAAAIMDWIDNGHGYYKDFARHWLTLGWSPIFEWLSLNNQIVIEYAEDNLVLTAMRNQLTGAYKPLEELETIAAQFAIPVVGHEGISTCIHDLANDIRDRENTEGVVLRFEDGHMLKIKTAQYAMMHRALTDLASEPFVLQLITDGNVDDVLPLLTDRAKDALLRFNKDVLSALESFAAGVADQTSTLLEQTAGDRKAFALAVKAQATQLEQPIMFDLAFGKADSAFDLAVRKLRKYANKGARVDAARDMFGGLDWQQYHDEADLV